MAQPLAQSYGNREKPICAQLLTLGVLKSTLIKPP